MRRIHTPNSTILIAIFAATMGLAIGLTALAEADGPDFYRVSGVESGDVLNIRIEPNAKAQIIGAIPPTGAGLRNLGCQGGPNLEQWSRMNHEQRLQAKRQRWCRIEYEGVEGWVAGWYLVEDSAP